MPDQFVEDNAGKFNQLGLVDPNQGRQVTDASGNTINYAATPTPTQNPYDVPKILGPALTIPQGPAPQIGNFVDNPGGGYGMGHIATQADVQAHHDAYAAAKQYADLSQHYHQLHNDTQTHLDTAAALHGLIGKTDPQEIAAVLAQSPNYDPNKVHPVIVNLLDRQKSREEFGRQLSLMQAKQTTTAPKDLTEQLRLNYKITPDMLVNSPVVAGIQGEEEGDEFNRKTEAEGATHIQMINTAGKAINIPVKTYHDLKDQILAQRQPTTTPAKAKPTDAEVAARIGVTAPQPAGGVGTPDHSAAVAWATANPKDLRAAQILARNQPAK